MTAEWDARARARGSGARTPRRRGPTTVVLVALLVAANILALAGLWALGAFPTQFKAAGVDDVSHAGPAVGPSDTPASRAVAATIATEIPGFSGAADMNIGAGHVTAYPCKLEAPALPTVGRYRLYSAGDQSVAVSVSAFPTGTGPWTIDTLAGQLTDCGDTRAEVSTATGANDLGVEAVSASLPAGRVTLVRRGDVIVQVIGPKGADDTVAKALDAALASHLGDCKDQTGARGDERRNPWLANIPYQGLLVDAPVQVPALGAPAPPAGITTVALDAAPLPLPTVDRPERPADPVWPAALPAAIEAPTAPAGPGQEPTTTVIKVPVVDAQGPGCGWAFTSTTAPNVDPADIQRRSTTLQDAARTNLLARQQAWRPTVLAYYQQWADYTKAALAYGQYANTVATVAAAWQVISQQRQDYAIALAAWQDATDRRTQFLADQQRAQSDYLVAQSICNAPTPSPVPTPTLTPTPTPTPTPSPAASVLPSPTVAPLAYPKPNPLPSVRPGCPAARPAILDELPPTVPVKPTPPPDPRPPEARG